jgi:hypothetical protein
VLATHGDYVRAETLTTDLAQEAPPAGVHAGERDLEGTKVVLGVRKS